MTTAASRDGAPARETNEMRKKTPIGIGDCFRCSSNSVAKFAARVYAAVLLFGCAASLSAQSDAAGKLRLVHADSAISFEENGRIIRELIGNVEFAQDSASMTCDRAREIPAEKKTIFTGNVKMRDGQRWLRANEVFYFEGRKEQRAVGNVAMGEGPSELRARVVTYFQKDKMAIADSNVVLTNSERRLRLTCGHLTHLRDKEYTDATIKPVLIEYDSLNAETMRITGERIELFDGGKRAKVSRQVKITRSSTRAECGEAEYFRDAERLELRVDPVAWQDGDKMKGKRIDLFLSEQKLSRAHVVENAEMTSEIDTVKVGKRINTLSGQEITMFLKDEKVEKAIVDGTATSEYYVIEEGKEKGKVRVQGDKITLFVDNQILKRVVIESDPGSSTGRFLPAGTAGGGEAPIGNQVESEGIASNGDGQMAEQAKGPPPDSVEYDKGPQIVKRVNPVYPKGADKGGLEGTVWVKIWIGQDGKPRQAEVTKSPAGILDQAAIDAAMQMVFTPAMRKNQPVEVWVSMPFQFYRPK